MPDSNSPLLPSDLLDRYLAGMATPAEADQVHAWLDAYPAGASLLAGLTSSAVTDQSPTSTTEREAVWQRIVNATQPAARVSRVPMDLRTTLVSAGRRGANHRMGWATWSRWISATAVLTLVVAGLALAGRHVRSSGPITYATTTTRTGQVAHLTLADGTHVTLAPNSTLGVARSFTSHREITLTGEAYFDVVTQQDVPFVVHTGDITTRVLGTQFDVTRYPTDRETRVVVVSGKVVTGAPRQSSVTLVAGAMGRISDSSAVVTALEDASRLTSWTTGELVFRAAPVRDVVADLARTYNVTIRITDSTLADRRVDWTVRSTHYSLSQVLPELLLMLNAHAQERNGVITVVPGHTASPRGAGTRSLLTPEWQYGR